MIKVINQGHFLRKLWKSNTPKYFANNIYLNILTTFNQIWIKIKSFDVQGNGSYRPFCFDLNMDGFVDAPSPWETTLQCNACHWQGAYTTLFVTSSFIGWAEPQNDPCLSVLNHTLFPSYTVEYLVQTAYLAFLYSYAWIYSHNTRDCSGRYLHKQQ